MTGTHWANAQGAALAATLTAILRLDLAAEPTAIRAWLSRPLGQLITPSFFCATPRLDPVTRWCLEAFARHHVHARCLSDDIEQVLTRIESELRRLLPPGRGSSWQRVRAAVQATRRLHLPVAVRTAMDVSTALSPHSRWRTDYGPVSRQGRADVDSLALQHAIVSPRMPIAGDAALKPLRELCRALRGENIADAGQRARLTRPQAAKMVASCLDQHAWGGLESIVLTWSQDRLRDPGETIKPQSIARYLSALMPVIQAQQGRPILVHDPATQSAYVDTQQWELVASRLQRDLPDQQTVKILAQMHSHMQDSFSILRQLDIGLLAGLGGQAHVASHVVTPREFELALADLPGTSALATRSAVAAALQFYCGLRVSEALGLLAADVVITGSGMLRVWAHPGRPLKTRARRLTLSQFLPAHWHAHLCELARDMRRCGGAKAYLFADTRATHAAPDRQLMHLALSRLREVTGDIQITPHSLRHSMATWAALQMAVARVPALRAYPAMILRDPMFEPAALAHWSQRWFGGPVPSRPLATLARILGHSRGLRSLSSYIHVMDLVQRALETLALPTPRRELLASLLELDMPAFKRLEKRSRARLSRTLGPTPEPSPTSWAIIAEMDRRHQYPWHVPTAHAMRPLVAALQVREVPVVVTLLRAHAQDAIWVARTLDCPVSEVMRIADRLRDGAPVPVEPEARSRAALGQAADLLQAMLDQPATQRTLAAWRAGVAISPQRRHWIDPAQGKAGLPLLAKLLPALGPSHEAHVIAVLPHGRDFTENDERAVQRKLSRLQRWLDCPQITTRLATWRELRLSPQPARLDHAWRGCQLVVIVGSVGNGRALGNGQGLMAAFDGAALLAAAP